MRLPPILLALALSAGPAGAQVVSGGVRAAVLGNGCHPTQAPTGGQSSDKNYATYTNTNATRVVGQINSPDCTFDAMTLTENTAATVQHFSTVTVTFTVMNQAYTFTTWVKRVTGSRYLYHEIFNSTFANAAYVIVDPGTCTAAAGPNVQGTYTAQSVVLTPFPGGWCKVALKATVTADTALNPVDYLISTVDISNTGYTGDGVSSLGLWGADLR